MKDIFEDLIKRYEEKKKELFIETNPQKTFLKEIFLPSETPKAEEIIEQEIEFYRSFEQDMLFYHKIKNKTVSIDDWNETAHFLNVHNERLSSQIDNASTLSAIFATLAMISVILTEILGPQNWIIFTIVIWGAFQNFQSRLEKRHELSRNRELLAIIENYISKNAYKKKGTDLFFFG